MRLAVDVHGFGEIRQGTDTFIRGLYSHLPKVDPSIEVISFGARPPPPIPHQLHRAIDLTSPYKRLTWGPHLALSGIRADYVHFQNFCPPFMRSRTIVTVHDVLPLTHPQFFQPGFVARFRMMLSASLRFAHQVHTVSHYSAAEIERLFPRMTGRVRVVSNAVDVDFYSRADHSTDTTYVASNYGLKNYILCVSRIEKRKNIPLLIDAVRRLRVSGFPQLQLVIAGAVDESSGQRCERTLQAIQQHEVVHLSGVQDDEKGALLRAASLFVFPSLAEGFGLPPLEAMAAGTPTVVARNTAMERIYEGATAFVSGQDSSELAAVIKRLFENESEREGLVQSGAKLAELSNWTESAKAFVESMQNLNPP